ncbi:STAS domain-containing protein [Streptomyces sp. NPDC093094]|uniref:STAS domain-containing protein n=1 Tax=Streptomyces sp. NPDC093094 TaxID=3366026 RepID=UPI00381A05BA
MTDNHGAAGRNGLTITSGRTAGAAVVTVRGEIDHHTAAPLRHALTLPQETGVRRIVVDLAGVTFMDSSGVNLLIAAHNAARDSGGWLRVAGPTEAVQRTMQLVGLDEIIGCHSTLEQALNA